MTFFKFFSTLMSNIYPRKDYSSESTRVSERTNRVVYKNKKIRSRNLEKKKSLKLVTKNTNIEVLWVDIDVSQLFMMDSYYWSKNTHSH